MATADQIRKHAAVVSADGVHIGTVDDVQGDKIKLTKTDSADSQHHYVPLSAVVHVDDRVHLSIAAADALRTTGAAGGGVASAAATHGGLPPIANPAIGDGVKRSNYYLPWVLLALALLVILLLLLKGCEPRPADTVTTAAAPAATDTAALPVEQVTLPGGAKLGLAPRTLNYELQRYLASDEPAPRAFTFDKLNFDTNAAVVRDADQDTVNALSQILAAYPNARAQLVGYADARGTAPANSELGLDRAKAIVMALIQRGVAAERLEAVSGGETNPVATNATGAGQFANRRTELVVTAK